LLLHSIDAHVELLYLCMRVMYVRVIAQVVYAPLRKTIRKFSRDGVAMQSITYKYSTTLTSTKAVPVVIVLEQAKPYIDQDRNDLEVRVLTVYACYSYTLTV
jgi:hypothetical protein